MIKVHVQKTVIGVHVAEPCFIYTALSGSPKECINILPAERTIVETVTLREGVKAAAVV